MKKIGSVSYTHLLTLCIFGGLATLVIYGLLMDTSTVFMSSQELTWQALSLIHIYYMQKVTVKDKKTKFIVSEGGDYFIDKRVKTKSLNESTTHSLKL